MPHLWDFARQKSHAFIPVDADKVSYFLLSPYTHTQKPPPHSYITAVHYIKLCTGPSKCRENLRYISKQILDRSLSRTRLPHNACYFANKTHRKASCLSWFDQLYVTRHSIFTHSTFHPYLQHTNTHMNTLYPIKKQQD